MVASWLRFEHPSIFLASPSDMAYIRQRTKRIFYKNVVDDVDSNRLELYTWEKQEEDNPFKNTAPAQEQIPSPEDPLCRGVIAFFGEWIGKPLPYNFSIENLDILSQESSNQRYRWVHPWRDEAVETGGFPLTGSTFEVLSAIAAHERHRIGEVNSKPELLLRIIGPKDLHKIPEVGKAAWGNRILRKYIKEKYTDDDESTRLLAIVKQQLQQLRNFVLFLDECLGQIVYYVKNEDDAAAQVEEWLKKNFGTKQQQTDRDPFKGLSFYDVEDTEVFYGRDKDRDVALKTIHTLWGKTEYPRCFWVRGASGAGKSSFLRAGIIGRLIETAPDDRSYVHCVLRPNELTQVDMASDEENERHAILRQLLRYCLSQLSKNIDDEHKVDEKCTTFDAIKDEKKVEWATKLVMELVNIPETDASGTEVKRRMVLGIDQFEEIVDQATGIEQCDMWESTLRFLLSLSLCPDVLIVATMRENRHEAINAHPVLTRLWSESHTNSCFLGFPKNYDLIEIIKRPFEGFHDLKLHDKLIAELTKRIRAFAESRPIASEAGSEGSLLPLVSLTLERLYKQVVQPELEKSRNLRLKASEDDEAKLDNMAPQQFENATKKEANAHHTLLLTVELAQEHIAIERAIGALASEAADEAKNKTGPNWDDGVVGTVLRRLISWAGGDGQRFSLPAAEWPDDETLLVLAKELKSRRLIVDENAGRIRLVHEAVIDNWPAARSWLDHERPLLKKLPQLVDLADQWNDDDDRVNILKAACLLHIEEPAAKLLALHWDLLKNATLGTDLENRAILRDFCLALLAENGNGAAVIEDTLQKPTHLLVAVAYQRADIVHDFLIANDQAVNIPRSDGRTAIFWACFQSNVEMLDLLLKYNADPDVSDEKGWRPIHLASVGGSVKIVNRLVEAGASLDEEHSPDLTTPLHLAADNGNVDLIDNLIRKHQVPADVRNKQGYTPLMRAAMNNHSNIISTLVELGADPSTTLLPGESKDFGWTALHFAARNNSPDVVVALFDIGCRPDVTLANGVTPLHLAAYNGNDEIVRLLIDQQANTNARAYDQWNISAENARSALEKHISGTLKVEDSEFDVTPLHKAVVAGKVKVIEYLVGGGADCNMATGAGSSALHLAAEHNRVELIDILMAQSPNLELRDARGDTPLHTALRNSNWTFAHTLIELYGASTDQPMHYDTNKDPKRLIHMPTPLQYAASVGKIEMLRFLLQYHASINTRDWLGRTALHYSANFGQEKITKVLIREDADLDIEDSMGLTPLHIACRKGSLSVVSELLSGPGRTQIDGSFALKPLHLAAHSGAASVVKELLFRGADLDIPDSNGMWPIHLAAQAGSAACVEELCVQGADPGRYGGSSKLNALGFAARSGANDVVRYLIQTHGMSPDIVREDGLTAIGIAIRYRQFDCVLELLQNGASVHAIDPDNGRTLDEAYAHHVRLSIEQGCPNAHYAKLEEYLTSEHIRFQLQHLHMKSEKKEEDTISMTERKKFDRSLSISNGMPGATAFFPEFALPGNTVWSTLEGNAHTYLIEQITPVDGKFVLESASTEIKMRYLPFYDSVVLIRVQTPELDELGINIFFLRENGNLFRLNGTSPPIHEINAKAPLRLSEDNVLAYLRFFTFFVQGEEGSFYFAETVDDPLIPTHTDTTTQTVVSNTIRPATFEGMNEQGHFLCSSVVLYSTILLIANFAVHPTGMVEMLDDKTIAADLPNRIQMHLS